MGLRKSVTNIIWDDGWNYWLKNIYSLRGASSKDSLDYYFPETPAHSLKVLLFSPAVQPLVALLAWYLAELLAEQVA